MKNFTEDILTAVNLLDRAIYMVTQAGRLPSAVVVAQIFGLLSVLPSVQTTSALVSLAVHAVGMVAVAEQGGYIAARHLSPAIRELRPAEEEQPPEPEQEPRLDGSMRMRPVMQAPWSG